MKFLYINNELCADCGKCEETCPTTAIYYSYKKRHINYDKCVSCGNCFRECIHKAISIEKIEKITQEMDKIAQHRKKVANLEKENQKLREELEVSNKTLRKLIYKLPVATILSSGEGKLIFANRMFMDYLDYEYSEIEEVVPGLVGAELRSIFPENIYNMFLNSAVSDEDRVNTITEFNGKNINLSVYSIQKGTMVLGIVRDLLDTSVVAEETIARIKESIDRQMAMVQKIGFLLGEEVSEISKNLNSVIKIINK